MTAEKGEAAGAKGVLVWPKGGNAGAEAAAGAAAGALVRAAKGFGVEVDAAAVGVAVPEEEEATVGRVLKDCCFVREREPKGPPRPAAGAGAADESEAKGFATVGAGASAGAVKPPKGFAGAEADEEDGRPDVSLAQRAAAGEPYTATPRAPVSAAGDSAAGVPRPAPMVATTSAAAAATRGASVVGRIGAGIGSRSRRVGRSQEVERTPAEDRV
jgi:hypothetical protein